MCCATALSAHRNTDKLIEQSIQFRPSAIGLGHNSVDLQLHQALKSTGAALYFGLDGLAEMVCREDVDQVLAAIVGAAGLAPVLAAVRAGKQIALANKESLVVGGSILIPEARKNGVTILPVDSEHSAVFQAMHCGRASEIKRVILTASGGPFRKRAVDEIYNATVADALNHPTWRMGDKITIDSATMFNKVLEIIEACWLFDIPAEKIEVLIHPESVIHSMVEFIDGSVIAQLSPPDMRTPIQYALTYPNRVEGIARRLDISEAFCLNFEPPNLQRFPALRLAYWAANARGTAGAVLNAANEVAVEAFLTGRIAFGMICETVELTISQHNVMKQPALDDLMEADRWARESTSAAVAKKRI